MKETEKNNMEIHFLYTESCNIWKSFCEHHNLLYQLSCQEHTQLLESDLDGLENCIQEKEKVIKQVNLLEQDRRNLIEKVEKEYNLKMNKAVDIINFFQEHIKDDLLEQYNSLLINIIENIQQQNKRNRIFLNKALYSLNQIKKDFSGASHPETYNAQGEKQLGMK